MRYEARKAVEILPTAQLNALLDRAYELLDDRVPPEDPSFDDGEVRNENFLMMMQIVRFVMVAAGLNQDVALLERLDEVLEDLGHWNDDPTSAHDTVCEAVSLLAASPKLDESHAASLARHAEAGVRAAAAEGLRAALPSNRTLLYELAKDSDTTVQQTAKERLKAYGGVPWWLGAFSADPAELLTEGAAALEPLRPALEAYVAFLARPWYAKERTAPGAAQAVLAPLPAALRSEAAWCALRTADPEQLRDPSWFAALMAVPEAMPRLLAVLDRWAWRPSFHEKEPYVAAVESMAPSQRLRFVAAVLERLLVAASSNEDDTTHAVYTLSRAVSQSWDPSADPTGAVERLVSFDNGRDNRYSLGTVADTLLAHPASFPPALWERFAQAQRENYPGPWGALSRAIDKALSQAPHALLRACAEHAVLSEHVDRRRWGMRALLRGGFEREVDGSRQRLLRGFLRKASTRKALLEDLELVRLALPLLRRRLRRGRLGFAAARAAMDAIGDAYGGLSTGSMRPVKDKDLRARRAEHRRDTEWVINAATYRQPPTEAEWAAYRAVRDPAVARRARHWYRAFEVLPVGSQWQQPDLALRDALDQRIRERAPLRKREDIYFMSGLEHYPSVERVGLWELLLARVGSHAKPYLRMRRDECRKALGLKPLRRERGAPPEEGADESTDVVTTPGADDDWGDP